jgi:uncharacterized protein HemX
MKFVFVLQNVYKISLIIICLRLFALDHALRKENKKDTHTKKNNDNKQTSDTARSHSQCEDLKSAQAQHEQELKHLSINISRKKNINSSRATKHAQQRLQSIWQLECLWKQPLRVCKKINK